MKNSNDTIFFYNNPLLVKISSLHLPVYTVKAQHLQVLSLDTSPQGQWRLMLSVIF